MERLMLLAAPPPRPRAFALAPLLAALACDRPARPADAALPAVTPLALAPSPPVFGAPSAAPPAELVGFWVWRALVENDRVVLSIADEDLAPRAGPAGWPGCPEGILCTRYGVNLLALGPRGEYWLVVNPTTSSDFQHVGAYAAARGLLAARRDRYYSCAHPGVNDAQRADEYLPYRVVDGELWVGTAAARGVEPFAAPPAAPSRWVVFRRASEQEFYRVYLLRHCQDEGRAPRCDPGCASERYGR